MIEHSADDDLREWFWRCSLNLQNAAIKSTPQIAHPCDADHFADDAMRRVDALCEQRVSAAVLAEQTRCARIANDARRKYRDMDAFIADEIYQDIRGPTAPAERPRSAP